MESQKRNKEKPLVEMTSGLILPKLTKLTIYKKSVLS